MEKLAIIDLDSILYIVAYKQFSQGNLSNTEAVQQHVRQFINNLLD